MDPRKSAAYPLSSPLGIPLGMKGVHPQNNRRAGLLVLSRSVDPGWNQVTYQVTGEIMKTQRQHLGALGEDLTAEFYERRGYRIRHRNVRYPCGELDLIVEDTAGTVVFAEVKTRRGSGFGSAESVTARKLGRMRRAAAIWLEGQPYTAIRFDVVTVEVDPRTGDVTVECYEGVEDGAR